MRRAVNTADVYVHFKKERCAIDLHSSAERAKCVLTGMSDEIKSAHPPPPLVAEQRLARMTRKASTAERFDSNKAILDSFPQVSVIKMS